MIDVTDVMNRFLFKLFILSVLCNPVYAQDIPFGSCSEHGKICKTADIDLYYEVYGKGEPLLLLHGNRGSIAHYTFQIPAFSEYFQVIAMDSRGQGKTTDADTIITYELMARDVVALIDSLGFESVFIVGWSDGANVGLELAKAHPEKIKRMVMFAGNYKIDEQSVVDNELYETLKNQLTEENSTEWKLTNLLLHYPQLTEDDLQKIKVPILVMAGEHDLIKDEHTREMQKHLPDSKLLIAKEATHYMPWEDSETFNDIALEYLLADMPVKTVHGKVVDSKGQALEYANIGIEGKDFGTMSFRDGLFELGIPYRHRNDTLSFLYIGFERERKPIETMDGFRTIELFENVYSLDEVTVTAKQPKRQRIGIRIHNNMFGAPALHTERAILMKPRKLPVKIEKLNITFSWVNQQQQDDSVYFRVKFYAVTDDGFPGENLSTQNIVIKHLVKQGWNELDLYHYNIVLKENFFVSIEWLSDLDKKADIRLFYGAVMMRPSAIFSRQTSFGAWNKIQGGQYSMNLQVLY